jgi:TRAP-type C4-dicarboxylate transport system permease small subunit
MIKMKLPRIHPRHQKLMAITAGLIILGFALYLFVTAYLYA